MMSRNVKFAIVLFSALLMVPLWGCPKPRPVPPPDIDLNQVNEAFHMSKGVTFSSWMHNFEQLVNEIYLKDDVVFVSARRPRIGKLSLRGYVDRDGVLGYKPGADKLLFRIEQYRGSHRFSYRLYDGNGWLYKRDYYRRSGAGTFLAYAFLSAALWRPYYTPRRRLVVIRRYRRTYRKSPKFAARRKRFSSYRKSTRKARRSAYRKSRRSRRRSRRSSRRSRYRSGRSRRSGGKW
tara:strand:- start:3480 stop:4184 length:705 start_codon:yes stop_codon:yes gene_type:complete